MDQVVAILNSCRGIMDTEFVLYGFALSYWRIMIYGMIALIVGGLVIKFLSD